MSTSRVGFNGGTVRIVPILLNGAIVSVATGNSIVLSKRTGATSATCWNSTENTMIKTNRILVHAALCGCVWVQATTGSADQPRPIERLGRWSGYGWSDGYHGCESSGLRLAADLPPRSFAATYGHREKSCDTGKCNAAGCDRCGATFYDRFDAANAGVRHGSGCDPVGCDAVGCDTVGCDAVGCDATSHDSAGHSLLMSSDETRTLPSDVSTPRPLRMASSRQGHRTANTIAIPVNVRFSETPDAATFRPLNPEPAPVAKRRPTRLPLVVPSPKPTAPKLTAPIQAETVQAETVQAETVRPEIVRPETLPPRAKSISAEAPARPERQVELAKRVRTQAPASAMRLTSADGSQQPSVQLNPFAR